VKSRFSATSLLPFAVFLLALLPRLAGLRWGLPSAEHWYSYHPDERQIVQAVASLDFFSGDFNPNFFNYPSLYIYAVHLTYLLAGMLGQTQNAIAGAPWPILHDIILCGRLVTALLGAATVPVVYLLGRELGGHKLAIVGALLMAFAPGHVQHSHFATVDVPSTFWVALALYFAVRGLRDDAQKYFLWGGLASGLAAATKYNAGLVLIAPLLAIFVARPAAPSKYFGGAVLACMLGFLIGCPFSVLSFSEFWGDDVANGFYYEFFVHSRQGHGEVFVDTGRFGWWYHVWFNLPFAFTAPLLMLAAAGIVLMIRDKRSKSFIPLLAFAALYFFALGFSQVRFMRYTLPLLPVLAISTAWAIHHLATRIAFHTPSKYFGVAAAPVALALVGAFNVVWPFVTIDPRDAAAKWLREQPGSPVTVGLANRVWFWTPPLSPQDDPPGGSQRITQAPDGKFQFVITGFDAAQLQNTRPQYFVLSELEWAEKERLRDKKYLQWRLALDNAYAPAREWKTQNPLAWPGRSYVPHDFLYASPAVRIYRLKS
jgi:hypothetical protein